ncbi:P-loop containing nucleoside triphosphate hydrolase protein [Elsinoe ampelina]|uniref:P-loop containing nucleoside triphosphate hydrolase protein n=1 Tax=Elsinoe ampelina TaxID=302913 RepID=A0A6A6G2Y9_9PEZI|nr:P-loop containing nucleoside triphosphate hydrolase protein [Elsinoe ampelina]
MFTQESTRKELRDLMTARIRSEYISHIQSARTGFLEEHPFLDQQVDLSSRTFSDRIDKSPTPSTKETSRARNRMEDNSFKTPQSSAIALRISRYSEVGTTKLRSAQDPLAEFSRASPNGVPTTDEVSQLIFGSNSENGPQAVRDSSATLTLHAPSGHAAVGRISITLPNTADTPSDVCLVYLGFDCFNLLQELVIGEDESGPLQVPIAGGRKGTKDCARGRKVITIFCAHRGTVEGLSDDEYDTARNIETKKQLRALLHGGIRISMLVEAPLAEHLQEFNAYILSELRWGPDFLRYLPDGQRSYPHAKEIVLRRERPGVRLAATNVFSSLAEWFSVIAMGFRWITEIELLEDSQPMKDARLCLFKHSGHVENLEAFHGVLLRGSARFSVGDRVDIRFKRQGQLADANPKHCALTWTARVMEQSQSMDNQHRSIHMKGPDRIRAEKELAGIRTEEAETMEKEFEPMEEPWNFFDHGIFKPLAVLDDVKTDEDLAAYLKDESNIFAVDVEPIEDDTMLQRFDNAMPGLKRRIRLEAGCCPQGLGATIMLILGFPKEDLPRIDFYEGVAESATGHMGTLEAAQLEFIASLRSMTCGVACLQGPAGVGKTFTQTIAVAPHCAKPLDEGCLDSSCSRPLQTTPVTSKVRFGCPILALAHSHENVDLQTKALDVSLSKVVMMRFPKRYLAELDKRGMEDLLQASSDVDEVKAGMFLARSGGRTWQGLFNSLKTRTRGDRVIPDSIKDDMYVYSMGVAIHIALGLPLHRSLQQDPHVQDLLQTNLAKGTQRFKHVRALLIESDRLPSGKVLDPKKQVRLKDGMRDVRHFVLRVADAVSMTASQSLASHTYEYLCPTVIVIDEAPKIPEALLFAIRGVYPGCQRFLLAGDKCQIGVHVDQHQEDMPTVAQYRRSFFERAINLGYTNTSLNVTYRFNSTLANLSRIWYGPSFRSVQITEQHPHHLRYQKVASQAFGTTNSLIVVNVKDGSTGESRVGNSRTNRLNARAVAKIYERLLTSHDPTQAPYEPCDIGVLTPYGAQCIKLRDELLSVACRLRPKAALPDHEQYKRNVRALTINLAQGHEFDVGILDMTVSKHLGFVPDPQRLCVATTRARFGLVIVADWDAVKIAALNDTRYDSCQKFRKLIMHMDKNAVF